jgi:hypothetical protein
MGKEQIEKMAVIMREAYLKECIHPDCHNCEMYNHDDRHNGLCKEKYRAEALYNAGYRKADEVALEAVDNFQSRLRNIFCTMCCGNDYNTVCLLEIDSAIESLFDIFITELKKKYTEERK